MGKHLKPAAEPTVLLSTARASITRIWLIGAGCSALILVVSSILRGRADAAREVWSWFLPLPTIGLMIGVLGAAAVAPQREATFVRKSYADMAWWLSAAYLAILSLTILLEPFSSLQGADLHEMSNYWLGPFQGVVVAALGYLYKSGERASRSPSVTKAEPDGTVCKSLH